MFSVLDVFLEIEHLAQARNIVHCQDTLAGLTDGILFYLCLLLFKCNRPNRDSQLKILSPMVVLTLIENHLLRFLVSFEASDPLAFVRD